jgi:methyl-accepting chemotaxis protein
MSSLFNLKIGARLSLGFAALLAFLLVVTGIGLRQMSGLADSVTRITSVDEVKMHALQELTANLNGRALAARNLVLVTNPAAQAADIARVKAAQIGIDRSLGTLTAMAKDPAKTSTEERTLLDELRGLEAKYLPIATNIVALATTQQTEKAVKALTEDCMPLLTQVLATIGKVDDLLTKNADANAAAAQAAYQSAKWLLLVISGLSLAIGTLVAWWLTRSITAPIREAVDIAQRVAAGDLTACIEVHGRTSRPSS